ncbi:hypothetical protein KSS87_023204 [Heliosperma pusillum]|nr:hypothetical protein KSS87_023204 [Heliosperma pusillum]
MEETKGTCILLFLSIFLLQFTSSEDQVTYLESSCSENLQYDQGRAFENNLDLVLSNLTSKATTNKFYNFTAGEGTNKVYGLFLCNNVYINQVCQDCILIAKGEIQRRCPSSKEAIVWYTECMLRYANRNIFSINDISRFYYVETGPAKYSQFNQDLTDTFISLSHQVTSGNFSTLSATTVVYVTKEISLCCYVDCTPDLSPSNCGKCLQTGVGRVKTNGTLSGVLLQPSCRLMYGFSDAGFQPTAVKGLYVALGIVSLVAAASLLWNIVTSLKRTKIAGRPAGLEDMETMENLHFEFDAIQSATDNFSASNKLGQGGFGIVYMGTLPDGQAIAVKRLSKTSGQGIREFKMEACLAAKLQHKNLVKLFGFCLERDEMLLVYEFVPNKSLDRHLFDPKGRAHLNWGARYKIIVGIARGLLYLHEDSHPRIIHRDLKPSNILLDGEMSSKIADFGMAKLFGGDQTQGDTSRVAGTFGYMAPEYVTTGHFSVKSDIFSYGVILLEIVSGLRINSPDPEIEDENFLNYVWRLWDEGNLLKLLDPSLENDFSKDEVERCIHVGLLCIQEDPAKRPNIASILFMLHTKPISLPLPELPITFHFILLFLSIPLIKSVNAGDQASYLESYCADNGNYDQGSEFENNLNFLLTNLTSKASTNDFYNFTTGKGTNRVYGLFLCNNIYINENCQDCILAAKDEVKSKCSSSVEAIIWYTECMVRYANRDIFSANDISIFYILQRGPANYSQFNQGLKDTFKSLSNQASSGNSSLLSATTVVYVTKEISLSCFAECTPDLNPSDCDKCLQTAVGRLQMDGVQSEIILQPSSAGKGLYIALGVVSSVTAASLLLVIAICLKRKKVTIKPTVLEEIETMENLHFEFSAIRTATDNFSAANKLGQGGFGVVYMGILAAGQAFAVKRLSNGSGQGIREFKTEACLTAKLQHKNLVKLFGFCLEKDEMLLVYEYVPNKSLDRYLFDPKRGALLTWKIRYKIIVGIAKGLLYLHDDSRPKIIHRDLKPSNILLDGDLTPKIADFGMAKLFGGDQTQGNTSRVAGTFGYMAPEYATAGHFSVKSDIFSYGVILLEIISGLRNYSSHPYTEDENLLNYASRLWDEENHLNLVDQALGNDFSRDEVERCIHVALLCIQEDPAKRPTAESVLLMLHTKPISLPPPSHPPTFPYRPERRIVLHESQGLHAQELITELSPR